MENHIVRPRKKGNKNKNSNGTSTASSNLTQNGHGHKGATGFTIYHGDGTTTTASITATTTTTVPNGSISSPARRREVSPIQNHTTSRFGWQSPSEESAMSPKSDNFLYVQHPSVKAQTLSTTAPAATKGSHQHRQHQQRNFTGSANSSGGGVSGSCNAIVTDHNSKESHQQQGTKRTKTLSPSSMFRRKSSSTSNAPASGNNSKHPSSQIHPLPGTDKSNQKQKYFNGTNCSNSHYEEIQNNNNQQQQQQQQQSHRKEYILEQKDLNRYHNGDENGKNEASTPRYGRLLPSKMASGDSFNSTSHLGSYDSLNANVAYAAVTSQGDGLIEGGERVPSNNNNGGGAGAHINGGGYPTSGVVLRNGYEANRQMLRSSRYNGVAAGGAAVSAGNGMMSNGPPVNQHPMGHIMNSLSSPESAYSTGYSTDGTSPGATYTPPEYYINMRTGTHYFPKSVNTLAIEAQRYKFGLNKIEEMSPQDPLPNNNNNNNNNHRRTESFDSGQSKIPGLFGIPDPEFFQNQAKLFEQQNNQQNHHQQQQQQQHHHQQLQHQQQHQQQQHQQKINVGSHSPLPLRNTIVIPTLKGFESPSPRQRCRIRTNPWYSTTDTSSSGTTIATTQAFLAAKKMELDASSSSSGIKSSSEAGASDKNEKNEKTSDESTSSETSSSSTEVENLQRTYSPNTIRRKKQLGELLLSSSCRSEMHSLHNHQPGVHHHLDSDEDATLNEMMGKFDESYVYEKETDILSSDSDPTDCASDLDTGQDAGDECDTDDMLDIEFIDTTLAGQEAALVKTYQLPRRASRQRHLKTYPGGEDCSKRKKKLMKTRKKSTESKGRGSPMRNSRESRSLGGTPVCLRRNQSADYNRSQKSQSLSTRCSSLTFTEVHSIRSKFIAIGESEKALLRADLEADVKYRQLIHEAETILVSMKTSALSIPRETPVASPRRVCNPLANKRVEMLKQCEADIKRELLKQQQKILDAENNVTLDTGALNKRLESLKYETNSAPNSPKSSRFSPRKTHITNFINQNAPPEVPPRRSSIPEPPPRSPQLQLNGRSIKGKSASPLSHRRRFRSQSPKKHQICSDSDSDENLSSSIKQNLSRRSRSLRSTQNEDDRSNRNCLPEIQKITIYNESDYTNRNVNVKPPLMSFKSFGGVASTVNMGSYCPQSEPLKRKVYRGSSSFERIKKSLDLDSEIPKQAILEKINNIRRERQSSLSIKSSNQDMNHYAHDEFSTTTNNFDDDEPTSVSSNLSTKQQLILDTIEDLKRSLEYQSVELNGLNEDE